MVAGSPPFGFKMEFSDVPKLDTRRHGRFRGCPRTSVSPGTYVSILPKKLDASILKIPSLNCTKTAQNRDPSQFSPCFGGNKSPPSPFQDFSVEGYIPGHPGDMPDQKFVASYPKYSFSFFQFLSALRYSAPVARVG